MKEKILELIKEFEKEMEDCEKIMPILDNSFDRGFNMGHRKGFDQARIRLASLIKDVDNSGGKGMKKWTHVITAIYSTTRIRFVMNTSSGLKKTQNQRWKSRRT